MRCLFQIIHKNGLVGYFILSSMLSIELWGTQTAPQTTNQTAAAASKPPTKKRWALLLGIAVGGVIGIGVFVTRHATQAASSKEPPAPYYPHLKWIALKPINPLRIKPIDTNQLFSDKETAAYIHLFIDLDKPDTTHKGLHEAGHEKLNSLITPLMEKATIYSRYKAFFSRALDDKGNTLLHYLAQWHAEGWTEPSDQQTRKRAKAARKQLVAILSFLNQTLDLPYLRKICQLTNNAGATFPHLLHQTPASIERFLHFSSSLKIDFSLLVILFCWEQGTLDTQQYLVHSGKKQKEPLYIQKGPYTIETLHFDVVHDGSCMARAYLPFLFESSTGESRLKGLEAVRRQIIANKHYQQIVQHTTFQKHSYGHAMGKDFVKIVEEVGALFKKIDRKLTTSAYNLTTEEQELLVAFIKDLAILHAVIRQKKNRWQRDEMGRFISAFVRKSKPSPTHTWWIDSNAVQVFSTDFIPAPKAASTYKSDRKELGLVNFRSRLIITSNDTLASYLVINRLGLKEHHPDGNSV